MNEKPLQCWLIILPDGAIATAHCTCMAGLGEVCNHSAAIAFQLYPRNQSISSCTDKLSVWPVPKAAKSIVPKKLRDVNWGKNGIIFWLVYLFIRGEEMNNFLSKLS